MKVQVTLLVNVEVNRSDYVHEQTDSDEDVRMHLRDLIDNGDLSMDDLMEQSTDYTVTVVEAPAT
jgi:actin-related protein